MLELASALERLPEELRWTDQWCIAGPDERGGMKAPYTSNGKNLFRAKSTDYTQRLDFETALEIATVNKTKIGFMLQRDDPYVCIDLDVKDHTNEPDPKKWTSQEHLNRFWAIVQAFNSYTEKSASGKGLHIWLRGKIDKGCRRDGVEVYPHDRFIICTGNVLVDQPIKHNQELLDILVREISNEQTNNVDALEEIAPTESDEVIWQRASSAANNEKFIPLCQGKWKDLQYPSQSEADLALMSMFCFYSKSNEQCRRLFRLTELGKREKAVKNNRYLDYTISRIRGRQQLEALETEDVKVKADAIIQRIQSGTPSPTQQSAATAMATIGSPPPNLAAGLPWPPGLMGAIAGYIYNSSPRPVKEVSIVAALGMMAGICGRSWNIPQSGLNLYIILVARSAIGKEAMHSGIASIINSLRGRIPGVDQFFDFSDFASGPALSKAVASKPSFVNVAGEWGRKLRRMAKEDKLDGPMQQLRTVMTNLYQKSSTGSIVGGITYSNKEQNISSVSGVAFSMIGETTPNTLYDALTEAMMEDGFLSRFTIIEYDGDRPPHNYNCLHIPDKALADAIGEICIQSLTMMNRGAKQDVQRDPEAAELLHKFDIECDSRINATHDESRRQMWNRAALKVTRIAALLAVADNHLNPVISKEHVEWALTVVRRDIALFQKKLSEGDIGLDDHTRERKMISVMVDIIKNGVKDTNRYPPEMIRKGILPRKLIQQRVIRHNSFITHRSGANVAMEQCFKSLIDSGDIIEVPKDVLIREHSFHGKCYRLLHVEN